jgi:hypothetical protein
LNLKTIFEALESSFETLETVFEALESIFEVGFVFFDVFQLGWPEMKNVAGDGIAGDGECRRWRGEGELEKKKKKKKKRKKPAGGVCEVREKKKKIGCFVLILFFLKW